MICKYRIIQICLFDFLYKTKHSILIRLVGMFRQFRIVGIGMMAVEELNDMKPAAVNIKMNISTLKIRCNGFPYFYFRVQFFDCAPGGIADSPAVNFWGNKQKFKVPLITFDPDDHAADRLSILHDPISLPFINGSLNGLPGDDLTFLFEMIIPAAEFFQCTVIKCFLIIRYELFPIVGGQWGKYYFRHNITS